jgi:hypothetical protein
VLELGSSRRVVPVRDKVVKAHGGSPLALRLQSCTQGFLSGGRFRLNRTACWRPKPLIWEDVMFDHTAWLDRTSRTQPYLLVDVGAFADDHMILDGDSPTLPRAVYAFAIHVVCPGASRDDRDISHNAGHLTDDYGTCIDDCTVSANFDILADLDVVAILAIERRVNSSETLLSFEHRHSSADATTSLEDLVKLRAQAPLRVLYENHEDRCPWLLNRFAPGAWNDMDWPRRTQMDGGS